MYFFRFVCLIACATASPLIQQNGDEIKLEKRNLQPPQKVQDGTRWYSQYLPVGSKGHLLDGANAIQPNIVKFKIISEVIDKTISIMDSSPIYFDNILVDSQQNRKYFYDKVEDQQDNKDCHRKKYGPEQSVKISDKINENQQPDSTKIESFSARPVLSVEEAQPVVHLNIPVPPSITSSVTLPSGYSSISSLQNDESLIVEKWTSENHYQSMKNNPQCGLNVPAPPSITDSITLPSRYSSLSSLRNDERLIIEKVKEYKTSNKGNGGGSVVLSNDEEKSFPDTVEVGNQQPIINEEQRTVTLNVPAPPSIAQLLLCLQDTRHCQSYEKTEIITEEPIVTEEVQPAVRLNVPAPPSITDSIALPLGYSSLSSLRNDERLIIEKVKKYKTSNKGNGEGSVVLSNDEEKSYPKTVEVGNQQPIINEEERIVRLNVPAPPSIAQTITLPSGYSSLSELRNSKKALIENIHATRRYEPKQVVEFSSESQQPDITRTEIITEEPIVTEEVQPAVRLNVPAPPSITDSIALPLGYSSLSSLRNDERLIIEKVKKYKTSNKGNGEGSVVLSNDEEKSYPNTVEVGNQLPIINEEQRIVRLNVPAPPSIAQTITLPSGYSSLSELRNSKKALIENIHATRRYEPKQVVEFTSESQQPDITRTEIITEEPIVNEEEVQPAVRLNVPAKKPENDERLIIERVKEYKTSDKGNGEGSIVLSNEEEKSHPVAVEIDDKPVINEEKPDITRTEIITEEPIVTERRSTTCSAVVEYTSESQQPDITRTEITIEEPIVTEEEVQPAVRLNVPAPPSITDSITLPSGYSSLSSLRNDERLIIKKVKEYKTSNKGKEEKLSYLQTTKKTLTPKPEDTRHCQSYETVKMLSLRLYMKGDVTNRSRLWSLLVKANNLILLGQKSIPKNLVTEEPVVTEIEVQPAMRLNVPAPPSIADSITLPSGYSSLSSLRNDETLIIKKIKENKVSNNENGQKRIILVNKDGESTPRNEEVIDEKPVLSEKLRTSKNVPAQWESVINEKHEDNVESPKYGEIILERD
ncbi:unnamed protein product [Leptosia nina]|uniref:Uncharacterized protein n=1 Tax=Leptosia nina TaxID=320188 RepID=A0AAV1JXS5_9NEOP